MTFTKEIFPYYQSQEFGHFYKCKLYTLYDNENKVGQFVISHEVAFISTSDKKFRIDIKNNILTSSEYTITDLNSKNKIGFYIYPIGKIGLKEIGTLELNNERYICNRQIVDIKNILKKSTWDYTISLENLLTEIVYTIKIETSLFGVRNSEFRTAKGEIKSNQTDNSLILIGLFFIERMLSTNDESA